MRSEAVVCQLLTLLDMTTTTATAEQNIDDETPLRQVPREKEERARKKEDCGEVPRKTTEDGHDELFYAAGAPLLHRRSRYRKLRTLTALRSHVRLQITAPCPRRTSGLISRQHAGLRRPPLATP